MSTLTGALQIVAQDIFTSSDTQQHVLGEMAYTADGRLFRYCKVGATALVPGKLYQSPAEDTSNFQNLTVSTNSVGDTTVTTTSTVTVTANQLAGGLLVVTSATTGAGHTYRIKSHPAATAAAVTFTLEDSIITATTGTVKVDVHPNPYNGVIVNPATASSTPVGVAVYPVAASEFGWVQTHGPVAVLADGAITVGTSLAASNATAGAVEPLTGVQAPIGTAMTGIATTEYGQVFLRID